MDAVRISRCAHPVFITPAQRLQARPAPSAQATAWAAMLLADKHDLQNKLRLNLLQIEEKELNFYTQSCYTTAHS